jgi:hypothetical protein
LPKQKKSADKKSADRDLRYARDKVFAKLAPLEFVSGVGIADSKLAVYLTRPITEQETRHIREVAASVAGGREVKFVTTQPFTKQ